MAPTKNKLKETKAKKGKRIDGEDTEKVDLNDEGIYLFWEDFNDNSCKDLAKYILEHNLKPVDERVFEITILINSCGGSIYSLLGLLDIIQGSQIPIVTIGNGIVASCGCMLLMSGHKRKVTTNSHIMSHQFSSCDFGKQHELIAGRKRFDHEEQMIFDLYKRNTKLPDATIKEELLGPSDLWLLPKEALEYNIVDEIIDNTEFFEKLKAKN